MKDPRSWSALLGLGLSFVLACKAEEEPPTPAERYCGAVAAQAASCGTGTPCDEALVTDCAGVAGLFNDSLLDASATCVEMGGNPLGCVVDSRESVQRSAAHDAFAAAFCSECALGISGCEETLFGDGDNDELAVAGALITPLGDALVTELTNECASGLTCLATFSSCAQEVLARQALPTDTLTCVVEQLTSGEGAGASPMCAATSGDSDSPDDDGNDEDPSGNDEDPSGNDEDSSGEDPSGDDDPSDPSEGSSTSEGDSAVEEGEASATTDSTSPSDPSYPNPYVDDCPGGTDNVGLTDTDEVFCSPVCTGGVCPDAATGNATPACVLSPLSSFDDCSVTEDCSAGETCEANTCVVLPETHCALLCDAGETCPDGMQCSGSGICLYSS